MAEIIPVIDDMLAQSGRGPAVMALDPRIAAAIDAPLRDGRNVVTLPRGAQGHPARPGTGPVGETCRSCRHSWPHDTINRVYWKCRLRTFTRTAASDIRIGAPACRKWEAR